MTSTVTAAAHERLSFEEYVALDHEHSTSLKHLLVSPLQYCYWKDNDRPDTDALRVGRAVHTAILQPERFLADYVLWDEGVRRGKVWDAFKAKAAQAGRTILTRAQYDLAIKLRDSTHADPVARRYVVDPGRRVELSLCYVHLRTGIRLKARIDLLSCGALVDIKSTNDPARRVFKRTAERLGYALQLALYRDACVEALGEVLPVKIIAPQSKPPFDVCVFDLTPETMAMGCEQLERCLDKLAECRASNTWPGIAGGKEVPLLLTDHELEAVDSEPVTFGDETLT